MKNICKFIPDGASDKIAIHCFIHETEPEAMLRPHLLKNHRAIIVAGGMGTFHIDKKDFPCEKGTLLFAFKDESIFFSPDSETEYMYMDFDGLRADTLFGRFCIHPGNRCFSGFDGIIPLWRESLSRASEANIDLASESMLLYAFSRIDSAPSTQNELIGKIIKRTEASFTDAELSVQTIADALAYNPKYISHIFKQKTGTSYTEYLTSLRIKYAISLLDNGIDSVKNIAFLSGFTDPLYFSTVFKKIVGMSPKAYIKKQDSPT